MRLPTYENHAAPLPGLILLALLAVAWPGGAAAQETMPSTQSGAVERSDDPIPPLPALDELEGSISTDDLRLIIKPLTADELVDQAEQWRLRLQAKQAQVSAARLAARRAEGDRRDVLNRQAAELEIERNALADRVDVVLTEWTRKGGDPGDIRDYVVAVSGADLDPADIDAWWTRFELWLMSGDGGIAVVLNLVKFVFVVVLAWMLARLIGGITRRALQRVRGASALLKEFLAGLVRKAVLTVGVVFALGFLGVNIAPFIAAIGAAGLVVGLALQGTLSNFASGIMILLYRPFDVGHIINAAGVEGKVQAMTLVSTTILTFDNQRIIVPNNSIWNDVITNVTGNATRRVDMVFGIGYGDDVEKAESILARILAEHPLVLSDPEPTIRLDALGDSSVNFIVQPWARTEDHGTVRWDVIRSVKQRFDAEGISIPFPQRDVHVYQETAPKTR